MASYTVVFTRSNGTGLTVFSLDSFDFYSSLAMSETASGGLISTSLSFAWVTTYLFAGTDTFLI